MKRLRPTLIPGGYHKDERGTLSFNNNFDASNVKRIYSIANANKATIRAWQGHKIEQRWFTVVVGVFEVKLIKIDNWEQPSKDLEQHQFTITSNSMDILHVPAGYVSSIQDMVGNSILLVMADYRMGEIKDEYRFDVTYFDKH
ncbi:WxcM-like domain-containing protein [Marixanthomonas spongiae]|uniref:Sugar epimerase n=1 Tax=Marixanthomonas spongiae TaxID=2174845 RepID=A0A2U0I3Q9_9FLAO|nr:WxcM-like domain-containing protein [Marixanthomonas spongiae]PVW15746.1 sugar epimerase [Marixanthomonas spongiae]